MRSAITVITAAVIAAAAIGGATAACGPTTTVKPASHSRTTPQPATSRPAPSTYGLPVGATITAADSATGAKWDVTLNTVTPYTPGSYDMPPPAGQHYIIIDVTYNVITGPADANEWDWTAKDHTGLVTQPQVGSGPNPLAAATLQTGQKIRGTVTLAATNGSGGTIVYSTVLSEQASWVFTAAQVGQ